MRYEEAVLRDAFSAYKSYARRVPRLLPRIHGLGFSKRETCADSSRI
jgi:hypothetical protein